MNCTAVPPSHILSTRVAAAFRKVLMGSIGRNDASKSIADLAQRVRSVEGAYAAPLLEGFSPGPFDVICARGKTPRLHAGNIHFQELIASELDTYSSAKTKLDKTIIVSNVVDTINSRSPNGGFVRQRKGMWVRLPPTMAREKVSQCFRDSLNDKYKSSMASKQSRRAEVQTQVEEEFESLLRSNDLVASTLEQMNAGAQTDEVESVFIKSNAEMLKHIKRHCDNNLYCETNKSDSTSSRMD